jgi:protoheme IX farnesyltransferase
VDLSKSPSRPIPKGRFSKAIRTAVALFKLRVVALLLMAAVTGAFLGSDGRPVGGAVVVLLLAGSLSAAGASAINEYLERRSDALMERTKTRPLVTGMISRPARVPLLGMAMVVGSAAAVLPWNPALAGFLLLGALIYVGVYTLWLKPRTPLNIVIGGAAGSCAVLSGGAAVGAWSDPGVVGLALLVFLWTPLHFWSLALVYREDYIRAGVPMLPAWTTPRRAALWGLAHGIAAGSIALMLVSRPSLGLGYLVPVLGATALLLVMAGRLVARPDKERAWRLFHASNLYLALVLLSIWVETILHGL